MRDDGDQVHVQRSDRQGRKCHSLTKCQMAKKLCVLLGLRTFWCSLNFYVLPQRLERELEVKEKKRTVVFIGFNLPQKSRDEVN